MASIHGFEMIREQDVPELKTVVRTYKHIKTKAELLSLINNDENKVFGVTFRTPPKDSTGVPHILEHSALCGSRKYPLKEPFVELLKGSLQTFLNAMTYPDKTCYPVASQNVQDFYNLIDVYLDAVFYPRLTPFVLQQEGWHFELEKPEDNLTYKGIVFSEMKGAYSSPDSLLYEYSQQSLFPDNTYGLDSGGDPRHIPDLTFDQFQAFHRVYYHPSNARIFFYGDDDPDKRLELVDDYLKDFEEVEVESGIPLQAPFERPRHITRYYAAGEGGEQASRGMLTVNWLLPETTDRGLNMAFQMLGYILLGMPGSPLRKALIDSGFGEDICGVGVGSELRQMYFSTGLKGINPEDAEKVEELIMRTLEGLVQKGIDPRTVEAALNTIEFAMRENNTGGYPRGLVLMLRALTTWLYEGDPLALVAFEAPLQSVKQQVSADKTTFENLIDRYLLKNPHRLTLLLKADPDLAEKEATDERERLARKRAAMGPEELDEIRRTAKKLKEIQETPDPPEALKTIPNLKLGDVDKQNQEIPLALSGKDGTNLLYHDLFTNGIAYLDLGFDLHALPQRYLSYVPLFGRALLEMGTEAEDFVTLSQRISRKTGGIHPTFFTSFVKQRDTGAVWLFLRGKAMQAQTAELMSIIRDVLLTVRLDDQNRFRQIVLEAKARQEQSLVPTGHQIVNLRLRSHFSEADWAAEQLKGVSYLFFLRELVERIEKDWPKVLSDLEEVRRILVNRRAMLLNVTLDEEGWSRFEPHVHEFLDAMPDEPWGMMDWDPLRAPEFEGLSIPSQVNYVGKGMNMYDLGYQFHGSAHVVARYLRNAWLWERIRMQGGAYGAFCLFDRLTGVLTFVSYRDPNLSQTLDGFDQSAQFLADLNLTQDELTKGIIGTTGDIDQYRLPDAKGYTSMLRYLSGETDGERQRMRDEVLGTTGADFKAFGHVLEAASEKGFVKVLGSEKAIQKALEKRPGWLDVLKVL
jgi:Zn-dependent M16 (insulinase) family peptidase